MDLKPVKSSSLAAVGYEDGVIRIQYRDGAVFEQFAESSTYENLLRSESKGRFVRNVLTQLKRIGTAPVDANETPEFPVTVEIPPYDMCCTAPFQRAAVAGKITTVEWRCPDCGSLWRGSMIRESNLRHWTHDPEIEVLR